MCCMCTALCTEAHEEDEKKDLDKACNQHATGCLHPCTQAWRWHALCQDGIADVQQMSTNDLINHKARSNATQCRIAMNDRQRWR